MWLVIVERTEEFEALTASFLHENRKAFVKSDTPFGAPLLMADPDDQLSYPSFLLLNSGWPKNREALIWCYKNMQIENFVSSGTIELLMPEISPESHSNQLQLLVPELCIKSESNHDLLSGPMLYEEYNFDSRVQTEIRKLLTGMHDLNVDNNKKLFSSMKTVKGRNMKKMLYETLTCMGVDDFTGELCHFARTLNIPVGCLKLSAQKIDRAKMRDLGAIWLRVFEVKHRASDQMLPA